MVLEPRLVTVNDLYAFDPDVNPKLDQFLDIIGRNFKQPEGRAWATTTARWRTCGVPSLVRTRRCKNYCSRAIAPITSAGFSNGAT